MARMPSPVAGDVAGWSIVRHLVTLVMVLVTMGVMMAVVSGPVRLGQRICPGRETK